MPGGPADGAADRPTYAGTVPHQSANDRTVVLESLPMAFYSLDAEWRFSYVNPAAEGLIGNRASDVVGRVVWDLYPAAVGTIIEQTYRESVSTGEAAAFEAYYPEPLNAWFEIHCQPVAEGLFVYFLDITDRRAASAADEQAAARSELMARLTAALTTTLDAEATAAAIPEMLVPDLADWCIISLVDDRFGHPWRDRIHDVASWHADPAKRALTDRYMGTRIEAMSESSPLTKALTTGRPVMLEHGALAIGVPSPESTDAQALAAELAPESIAVYPLQGHGRTGGVLTLANTAERGRFTPATLTTLREVVHPIGLSLDNSRLYAAHRSLSEELQRGLITELPRVPQLRLAARYWPASLGVHIGGDWYDAFRCRDQLCLVIGDVTGHDRDAAVAMSQVRNLLRGIAYGDHDSPVAVLTRLDEAIADLGVETMTTAVMATVTPINGADATGMHEFRWSNAGHLPPLFIDAEGNASLLDAAGDLILGLDAQRQRHQHSAQLPPGAKVLLYTDGLIERRGEHLDIGLERLRTAAARLADMDAERLCDALMTELGGGTNDDVALLCISSQDSESGN
jgi:hypothetical protein